MTFQNLILKLSEFWASRGCVLQQPLDVEVGAGTMHPETFLRVLGPAHWSVAYVQPSRRPADGRFGENPNRLFKHHQFQVILKPAPDEVQQMYLESLEACGINPRQHDIRFEEDNWESPTLGAWGIGWQVLFDGLEITQFTYFQQAGGLELAPISAELTYGLERIAMVLQRVDSVYDLEWAPGVKYRDVRLRDEVEQSKYVFGQVDLPAGEFGAFHRDLFDRYYRFAEALLRSGLIWPALEHSLEVLASVQHPRREQQHRRHRADRVHPARAPARRRHREGVRRADEPAAEGGRRLTVDRELLLEIGCEELPASWLPPLTDQIGEVVEAELRAHRLAPEVAGRDLQHAAAADGARRARARAADRSRGARHRAAGVRRASSRTARRRRPPPASRPSRASRSARSSASRRRRACTSAFRKRQRGKAAVDVLPTC